MLYPADSKDVCMKEGGSVYVCTAMREGVTDAALTAALAYETTEGGLTADLAGMARSAGGAAHPQCQRLWQDEVVVGHVQSRVDAVQKQACGGGNGILLCGSWLKDTRLQSASLNHQIIPGCDNIHLLRGSDSFMESLHGKCASDQAKCTLLTSWATSRCCCEGSISKNTWASCQGVGWMRRAFLSAISNANFICSSSSSRSTSSTSSNCPGLHAGVYLQCSHQACSLLCRSASPLRTMTP